MRLRATTLLAVLGFAGAASADADVPTLIPAQPVAPTRTEVLAGGGYGYGGAVPYGIPVTAQGPGCAAPTGPAAECATRTRFLRAFLQRTAAGVAKPNDCSCWAAEMTFFFGGCKAFYTPGFECTSCGVLGCGKFNPREYGPGVHGMRGQCGPGILAGGTGLPTFR